ncbi:MAG: energy transducer TonB [Bacteroidota bacterium]
MTKEKIESLDEIVFSNRNKDYGAYNLRKVYKRNVTIALLISCAVLIVSVAVPMVTSYLNRKTSALEEKTVGAEMLAPPPDKDTPPPPPPPPPEAMEQKVKFTAPIVTTDTTETTNTNLNQDDLNKQVAPPVDDNIVVDDNKTVVIDEPEKAPVFTIVEEMPSYPGGDESRIKFLTDNIKYPQVAKESGIQGTVYVTFVIDEKGRVTDVKVLRGIGGGCDEEAVRVVKLFPPWNAGKQTGKAVRVQFNMPIKFTLS